MYGKPQRRKIPHDKFQDLLKHTRMTTIRGSLEQEWDPIAFIDKRELLWLLEKVVALEGEVELLQDELGVRGGDY